MIAAKKKAVEDLDKLGDETYLEVATAAFDHRTIEVQRTISKRLGKKFFRNASKSDWKGVSNAKESLECPDQHSDSKPDTSNKSALKSPFIYRGDKIPEDGVLTFDVEKLVLKMKNETGKHENAASSVAVVNARNQPYSLKDVCKHFFPDDQFQCGIHSAIQDARKPYDLYVKKKELCQQYPNFIDYPGKIQRSPKEYDPRNNGICTCKPKPIHPNQMQPKKKKSKKGNIYYVPG